MPFKVDLSNIWNSPPSAATDDSQIGFTYFGWIDLMYNRAAPIKMTAVKRMVNVQIVFLFIILLALSVGSSIGSFIRKVTSHPKNLSLIHTIFSQPLRRTFLLIFLIPHLSFVWLVFFWQPTLVYLASWRKDKTMSFIEDILTFIILYNNLIPIS